MEKILKTLSEIKGIKMTENEVISILQESPIYRQLTLHEQETLVKRILKITESNKTTAGQ